MSDFTWTEEAVATLRKMDADGVSMTDIAAVFGVSRGTVAGKRHRLGIGVGILRPKKKKELVPKRPKTNPSKSGGIMYSIKNKTKQMAPMPPPAPPLPEPPAEEPKPQGSVHLLDLHSGLCKWPVGHMLFCGDPQTEGTPYCAGHARLAYAPLSQRKHKRR